MNENHPSAEDYHGSGQYEICLKGHLDDRWTAWFADLSIRRGSDGTTILSGMVADQAALYGLLRKVRDLGLPLISVNRMMPEQPDLPGGTA